MHKDRAAQRLARHGRLATRLRSIWRLRPTLAPKPKRCGEQRRAAPAPEQTPSRRDRAAGRTATSRRWHMTGTTRQGAAPPNRHRPFGRTTARNRRTGPRPGLRRKPPAARKTRPSVCSLRSGHATRRHSLKRSRYLNRRDAANPGWGRRLPTVRSAKPRQNLKAPRLPIVKANGSEPCQ